MTDLERVAVASPGQTVFLRVLSDRTARELDRLAEDGRAFTKRSGVRIVILAQDIEVAQIKEAT